MSLETPDTRADEQHTDDERTPPKEGRRKERHRAVPLSPEVRFFAPTQVEIRSQATEGSNEIVISGAAIMYGAQYRVVDVFGEFRETIHRGAASGLVERGVDCRLLLNHEGLPMARTTSGTMKLIDSPEALRFEATLDTRQQLANDFAIAIERGDLSQMSVGMVVSRDKWGGDAGQETRDIFQLGDLLDVSGVTYPCSDTTHIEVAQRMAFAMPVESRARLRNMEVDLRAGKTLSASNQGLLVQALKALHDLAGAGGIDPGELGPEEDEHIPAGEQDGSEGGGNLEDGAGITYPDGSGQRSMPRTAAERRAAAGSFDDQTQAVNSALQQKLGDGDGDCDIWICDCAPDWVVYESFLDPMGMFRLSYSTDADGAVTLEGDPEPVVRQTTYETVVEPPEERSATLKASTLRLLVEAGR